jgi:transcriptional regulator with XRE-family HTH domain
MKERIKQYMDYKSISAGELSSKLEVQRSNISHILNGRNKPGASFIEKLLVVFPDLNARWLFTGEGEMIEKQAGIGERITERPEQLNIETPKIPFNKQMSSELVGLNKKLKIEKIVLFYSDGTFKDFDSK